MIRPSMKVLLELGGILLAAGIMILVIGLISSNFLIGMVAGVVIAIILAIAFTFIFIDLVMPKPQVNPVRIQHIATIEFTQEKLYTHSFPILSLLFERTEARAKNSNIIDVGGLVWTRESRRIRDAYSFRVKGSVVYFVGPRSESEEAFRRISKVIPWIDALHTSTRFSQDPLGEIAAGAPAWEPVNEQHAQ